MCAEAVQRARALIEALIELLTLELLTEQDGATHALREALLCVLSGEDAQQLTQAVSACAPADAKAGLVNAGETLARHTKYFLRPPRSRAA